MNFFNTEHFMPHGQCYLWRHDILWLNVLSDLFIGVAYLAIPWLLISLVRKRRDLRFNWIFVLFAMFITVCGLTHAMGVITVWMPYYAFQGLVKAATAIISVTTAVALYYLMPKALAFPSIDQLEQAEQRYRTILHSAMDAFVAVDAEGRITFCNRQMVLLTGWEEEELIGSSFIEKFIPARLQNSQESPRDFFLKLDRMNILLKNGQEIPTDINATPAESGHDHSFGIFIHDASEHLLAEALRETQLEVTKALVDAKAIDEALHRFIQITCSRMGWEFAAIWSGQGATQTFTLQDTWRAEDSVIRDFAAAYARRKEPILPSHAEVLVQAMAVPGSLLAHQLQLRIDVGPDRVYLTEFLTSHPRALDKKIREVLQDLTNRLALFVKRQQAEEKTRISEERYRELVDSVKDYGIFLLDAQGCILSWNRGAERLTGYTAPEVLGRHVSIFYPAEANEQGTSTRELEIARTVGKFEEEGWRLRKDRSRFYATVIITPIYDSQEQVQGYSIITRDITNRWRADEKQLLLQQELKRQVAEQTEELRHSANQIRTITDALPDAIVYFDRQQNVLFANDTWLQWQCLGREAVHGRSVQDVLGSEVQQKMQPLFAGTPEQKLSFEIELSCHDRPRLCHVICIPDLSHGSGLLRGVITVLADITDQRSYEENLRIAKEAADAANAAKSAFLANMSHEIRTPLGAILGYSELLASQGVSTSERLNYVNALKRNGELLSNIINDVLDLSKVEAGKLDFERQEVPIEEILTDITTLLHLQAVEKGISLIVSAEGPIPASIETDPLRLRQILMNIVGNALKFTERGSIEVKVKTVAKPDGSTKLAFIVTDTGPGISPDQASKLFKPFSQADVSTTRKFGGTGLGLTLSKKLAAGLGGDLELTQSTPGVGSTFTITIDPGRTSKVLFQSSQNNLQRSPSKPKAAASTRIDGLKVLLVEDSMDNQIVVQRFLKMAGCGADLANNGREAIEKIHSRDYDVVLMDIQMPVMDGFEAVAELRREGYQLPVIALTAHALKEQRLQCLEAGFTNHITKPVNRDALISMLAPYAPHRESQPGGQS
ncbi:PAS domain S-box protein [Oligoflexus tunisiensis]|uniref:PAS domain S-box protein n=1 Tax=Oligoflexus tunisiensis TaxID=708132 RepID=UPI000AF097DD|nr:PAS domain S-box protein [Oligoflexus tunisiensis]